MDKYLKYKLKYMRESLSKPYEAELKTVMENTHSNAGVDFPGVSEIIIRLKSLTPRVSLLLNEFHKESQAEVAKIIFESCFMYTRVNVYQRVHALETEKFREKYPSVEFNDDVDKIVDKVVDKVVDNRLEFVRGINVQVFV